MLALFLVPLAFAGRVERVTELQTAGEHAEVVETVAKWEKGNALGDEAAQLIALRDRSALTLALAERTIAALIAYRQTWPKSALRDEALRAEWDLAFSIARDEGTSVAMRGYATAYPASPLRAQAIALEAGYAFEEAAAVGTAAAIAAFTESHPDSPYAATAWESLAARTPGIHVRLGDGMPQALEPVPVTDGHILFPSRLIMAPALPTVAVNLPGTGRGATSDWWGLSALAADGELGVDSPVGRLLAAALGVPTGPPDLLALEALPGAHSARVAAPKHPLVVPGACEGLARFAYVLATEGSRTAFSFAVDCATAPEPSAAGELLAAFTLAEAGDPLGAAVRWDRALTLPAGPEVAAWMGTLAADPRDAFLVRRPAVHDVLIYDGTATTWWHTGERGPVDLARRDGLWLADGPHLWRWEERPDTWTAPATGRCKAGTGARQAVALVDAVGGARVEVPFTATPREGTLAVTRIAGRAIELEETATDACGKAPPPATRSLPLPEDRAAPAAPAWAAQTTAGTLGFTVIGESARALYGAFVAPPSAPVVPADSSPPAPPPMQNEGAVSP